MTIQIQVIATAIETKPTAKGSYQQLELTFKNLTFQGKVESKKIMSFGANANAFKLLSNAQAGQVYDVEVVKNAQGYNDWPTVTLSNGAAPASPAKSSSPTTPTKTTYETPEERAQRQILIVRQSSVSSACSALSVGSKAPLKIDDILTMARQIENYVFNLEQEPVKGASGFDDLPDFEASVD